MSSYLYGEELKNKFNDNKKIIDEAFLHTREKYIKKYSEQVGDTLGREYGNQQAVIGVKEYFMNFDAQYITNEKGDRSTLKEFSNCLYQNQQILFDYAISSYLLNDMKSDIDDRVLDAYASDMDGKLDYSPMRATKVVALSLATNPYSASMMIMLNSKLKEALVNNFIKERYMDNKAMDLDNLQKAVIVNVGPHNGNKMMSISNLNKDMLNMMNQSEEEFFDRNSVHMNQISHGSR